MAITLSRKLQLEHGAIWLWGSLLLLLFFVVPPFAFLLETSLTVERSGIEPYFGWANYAAVFQLGGDLWRVTILYAAGSSALAIFLGVSTAWLAARTNTPFRSWAYAGAFLALSAPVIVKGIGWILLLGPNKGVLNEALRWLLETDGVPIRLFSLGGMILIEGLMWTPVVFLLAVPPLSTMDPSLEAAAAACGAGRWQTMRRVTLPLAMPSILAVLLLAFIRALESFEVPLLIGTPARLQTFTTAIHESINRGFVPRYGEASAYAAILLVLIILPLAYYYRLTRDGAKYATVTGKAYRPARIDLGRWRIPCGLFMLLIPASLAAPLLIIAWSSFLPIYETPSWSDFERMSLDNYAAVLSRSTTLNGMWNSFVVGVTSSLVVTGFTMVLAWLVIRRNETARWLVDFLASMPLVLPGIVLGIALLVQFLALDFIPIYGTLWILVFAFLLRFLPYGMRFSHSGIMTINRELEESARVAGAGVVTVLWRIVLPLALPSLTALWIYVFMNSIRELSVAILLAGPQSQIISMVILELWQNGEVPMLGALSVLLSGAATLLGLVLMRLTRSGRDAIG